MNYMMRSCLSAVGTDPAGLRAHACGQGGVRSPFIPFLVYLEQCGVCCQVSVEGRVCLCCVVLC